jgi:hypothetical protein
MNARVRVRLRAMSSARVGLTSPRSSFLLRGQSLVCGWASVVASAARSSHSTSKGATRSGRSCMSAWPASPITARWRAGSARPGRLRPCIRPRSRVVSPLRQFEACRIMRRLADQSRWHEEVRSDVHLAPGKDARERGLVDEHRARHDLLAIARTCRRHADNEILVEPLPLPGIEFVVGRRSLLEPRCVRAQGVSARPPGTTTPARAPCPVDARLCHERDRRRKNARATALVPRPNAQ